MAIHIHLPARKVGKSRDANVVFSDYATWSTAVKRAGGEVYADGAASGKYVAKKKGEIYGRFDKAEKDGWLHSSISKDSSSNVSKILEISKKLELASILKELEGRWKSYTEDTSRDARETRYNGYVVVSIGSGRFNIYAPSVRPTPPLKTNVTYEEAINWINTNPISKIKDGIKDSVESLSANDIMEKYGATFLARVQRQREATAPDGKVVKADGSRFTVKDAYRGSFTVEVDKLEYDRYKVGQETSYKGSKVAIEEKTVSGKKKSPSGEMIPEKYLVTFKTVDAPDYLPKAKAATIEANNKTKEATKYGSPHNHAVASQSQYAAAMHWTNVANAATDPSEKAEAKKKSEEHRRQSDFHYKNSIA